MPEHYTPKPRFRTEDARAHCHHLYEHLQPWILDAVSGRKRHRLESENCRGAMRPADSILADCAQVLAACPDWDGALLAHHFADRGWPIDVQLVRFCHEWSCGLMDRIMAAHRARQGDWRAAG